MQPSYRSYLQSLANNTGLPAQEARALLQVTGDDQRVNDQFVSDPYGYTKNDRGQISVQDDTGENYWYGPQGIQSLNTKYSTSYNNKYSPQVQSWMDQNSSTSRLGGGGSTGGGSSYDPNDLAFIDSQIGSVNQGIGQLSNQRGIGLENILNSWQEAENKRQADKAVAERDYNTAKTDSTNSYLDSRSGIRRDAGNMYQSGRRALGAAGAGRSSALDTLLPFVVGKEAAMRFGETQDSFGKNQRGLDTSWSDTTRQYDEFGSDLTNRKRLKEQELEQGILGKEASLQDQLAQLQLQKSSLMGGNAAQALAGVAPIRDRISTILGQVDNLGKQYIGAVQPAGQVKFQAPELASYDYSKFAPVTAGQNQPALGDYVSPLTSIIQKRKELEK